MKVIQLQQQQLHPQQQHLLFPPFVVRHATNHNPVDIPFENARAAARCNIATRAVSERIGGQEVRRSQTRMQTIEKEERRKEGEQQQPKQKIQMRF